MHAKELGTLGELRFAAEALHHSYTVLKPYTDNRPYDFVLEKKGRFIKIQVKSNFCLPDTRNSFKFRVSRNESDRPYKPSEVDFFAFYLNHLSSFYLIPFSFCKGIRVVRMYPFGKKNALKEFKNNWDL